MRVPPISQDSVPSKSACNGCGCRRPAICLSISGFLVGSPEGQVVSQQLHDQRRVLVRILGHIVKLCNGILEGRGKCEKM